MSNVSTALPLTTPVAQSTRILRLKQVVERTGLSRSTIYDRISPKSTRYDASFPKPVKLNGGSSSAGAVGWLESSVSAWIEQRCQISDS